MPPQRTLKGSSPAEPWKRSVVQAACLTCRKRKLACDAERPSCARCRKRGDACTYPTADAEETRVEALKREISDLKSQLENANSALMRFGDVPGDLAVHVVREAASAPDPLAAIVTAAHQISRSSRHMDRVWVDIGMYCAASSLTATLRDRFPSAYSLLTGVQDALRSWRPDSIGHPKPLVIDRPQSCRPLSGLCHPETVPFGPPSTYFCINCYDSRLHSLDIHLWTSVPISNETAAQIISGYLEDDHPFIGCFDADLFLDDLSSKKTSYCSKLLVNSLLYYACKGQLPADSSSVALSAAFLDEANKELSNQDSSSVDCTTIGALHLLCVGLFSDEHIDEGMKCLRKAEDVAAFLSSRSDQTDCGSRHRKSLSYAVWGSWSVAVLWAYLQRDAVSPHRPSLVLPDKPHSVENRIPGLHSKARSAIETYITRINFALLLYDFGLTYGWKAGRLSDTVSAATAEQLYLRLMEISKTLQPISIPGLSTASMVLRMFFHIATMDVFRPLLSFEPQPTLPNLGLTPLHIFSASAEQLTQLVYLFCTFYPSSVRTGTWMPALVYTVNYVLRHKAKEHAQVVLNLCINALFELGAQYQHVGRIVRALSAIALRNEVISIRTAAMIDKKIGEKQSHHLWRDPVPMKFVLDLDWTRKDSVGDLEDAQVDALAVDFACRLAIDEFTLMEDGADPDSLDRLGTSPKE